MTSITERIQSLQQSIRACEVRYNRTPESVFLLAISKGHSTAAIEEAFSCGLTHFGESYWQEAFVKINQLKHLPIHWHFIGRIQKNKSAGIAKHCSWVHSLSEEKAARWLNDARDPAQEPLNVCIQVNLDEEPTKSGVLTHELPSLVAAILLLPRLTLKGLMILPKKTLDEAIQYHTFLKAAALLHSINQQFNLTLSCLSMGMSDDFPAAIRAGSRIIRIGTAIFGHRTGLESA